MYKRTTGVIMSVKLVREGEEAEEPIEIRLTQLTPQAVCSLFSISMNTVWLREQRGARVFFPNLSKTSFDVPSDVECLIAMGTPSDGVGVVSSQPSGSGFSTPILSGTTRSMLCPSRPVFSKKSIDGGTANVKIVQAHFVKSTGKGPNKFLPTTEQIFVPVKESTANVLHVTEIMQDSWGTEYVLITSDGLRIQDSAGTRGLSFWCLGSRKIFAVTKDDLFRFGGKGNGRSDKRKRDVVELSSSDEENPRMKEKLMTKLEELLEEMKYLRRDVTKSIGLPPGLCWSERALPDTCNVTEPEDFIATMSP
uniref:Uncharacterized protein n=1 Tax=Amphimedon queenslandica TaxID=400682 RepID=A0A1X7VJI3_AMPQE